MDVPEQHHPRYSQRAFPPYRFISGENPHPTESPQGHSYQKKEHGVEPLILTQWAKNQDYLFAIDLYNYAFWWESHEAWEGLWRQTSSSDLSHQFLQGLIKISAAFLKWHQHHQNGLEHLYVGGIEHLKHVCQQKEIYMGIDLMAHIAKLSVHFRGVIADEAYWPDPLVNYPFIVLEQ
ncbi:MAG: DUF309 domain-containing protein [Candidatus Omnitrophica bacterium]|nr:DUF309 domain-containing protein [Candidatus Omnitrophota bacterium]